MKQYKDLDLMAIAKQANLDFAHWSCLGNCSCCIDIEGDFRQKYFTRPKSEINFTDLQYILFKNANNGSGDVKENYVIGFQSDGYGGIDTREYPVYVMHRINKQEDLQTVVKLLQEQLGVDYKVSCANSSECIKIEPLFTYEQGLAFLSEKRLPRW